MGAARVGIDVLRSGVGMFLLAMNRRDKLREGEELGWRGLAVGLRWAGWDGVWSVETAVVGSVMTSVAADN
jgi:hypothetical protein